MADKRTKRLQTLRDRLIGMENDMQIYREERRQLMAELHDERVVTHADLMNLTGLSRPSVGVELARARSTR
jgi:hypothetical protein